MKRYNIARIKHGISFDNSCGCKIKSQFANVEVLFKNVPEDFIPLFQKEVLESMNLKNKGLINESNRTSTNSKVLSDKSEFLSIPYSTLLQYYSDLLVGDIMILPVLSISNN